MIRTILAPLAALVILAGCAAQQPAPPPLPPTPVHHRVPAAAVKPVHQDNPKIDRKIERLQNQIESLRIQTAPKPEPSDQ